MRPLFLAFPLIALSALASASAPFKLSIVPESANTTSRTISSGESNTRAFYVVLTDVSKQPQFVWESWNSWGYRSIFLELTSSTGKTCVVSVKRHGFTRNLPGSFLIPAGEQQVFPIILDASWEGVPAFPSAGSDRFTLKAIYEVAPSPEAAPSGVWVGRVSSKVDDLVLGHW